MLQAKACWGADYRAPEAGQEQVLLMGSWDWVVVDLYTNQNLVLGWVVSLPAADCSLVAVIGVHLAVPVLLNCLLCSLVQVSQKPVLQGWNGQWVVQAGCLGGFDVAAGVGSECAGNAADVLSALRILAVPCEKTVYLQEAAAADTLAPPVLYP